jgi:hypothetical protein
MRISGFKEFCRFNGIDDETKRSRSPYLILQNYQNGEYILMPETNSIISIAF